MNGLSDFIGTNAREKSRSILLSLTQNSLPGPREEEELITCKVTFSFEPVTNATLKRIRNLVLIPI